MESFTWLSFRKVYGWFWRRSGRRDWSIYSFYLSFQSVDNCFCNTFKQNSIFEDHYLSQIAHQKISKNLINNISNSKYEYPINADLMIGYCAFHQTSQINSNYTTYSKQMNLYYFGTMEQYVEAGYAPTGRATCKGCKKKIDKESVRLGHCMDSDHFNGRYWYHLGCFVLKPLFKQLDPQQQIYNLDHLESEDYDKVIQHVKAELERIRASKKKGPLKGKQSKASKKSRKQSDQQDAPENEDKNTKKSKSKDNVNTRQMRSTRSATKSKRQVPSKSPAKSTKSKSSIKKKKVLKKPKQKKKSGYTDEQNEKFKEFLQKYMSYTTDKIKQLLASNMQPKTGTKGELAEKCADGKLLGRIPLCSQCGGGKLRFDRKTGIYRCPGFMDDEDFKHCSKTYNMEDIVRQPWVE